MGDYSLRLCVATIRSEVRRSKAAYESVPGRNVSLSTSHPRICNGTGKQWRKCWEGFRCTGHKDRLLRTAVTPLRVSQICKGLRRQYPERTVPTLQNRPTSAFGGYAHPSD